MSPIKLGLLGAIVAAGLALAFVWVVAARRVERQRRGAGTYPGFAIGLVTNFLDTLGIGSFAPTTAALKVFRLAPDELIPGTLNVGLAIGSILESLIFITTVAVAPRLLVSMVLAAAVGAWFGAGIVVRLPRRAIQVGMGVALLIAGSVFAAVNLGLLPGGGVALDLVGWKFPVAVGASLVLGALMTIGIGMYAPTMILLALMGVHPLAAFPVMMGACALLMPVAGVRFVRSGWLAWGPALGLSLGAVIGVPFAAFVVKSLELQKLRWLVVAVVLYAAGAMLWSARAAVSRPPSA
ncbi:MAG TPA: sulfite exporter TauE/SafE family protein [Steroidobacteraceae bacterium]|nr:sulfite exporter TauE/SafE family protein [Steroidobacteraceae bacterium]